MRPKAARKNRSGVEWVGGLVSLPGHVTGEGEPFRPEALFWIGAGGAMLGSEVGKPGEVLGLACESLQRAIEEPMDGRPHAPARVRVASPELAEVLRAGHPTIEIVCAPTPEIDAVVAMLKEKMDEGAEDRVSHLSPGVDPDAIASLFRAAAGLFRAAPWKVVPTDESLLSVTIEALELHDAALCVVGQMKQSLGLILFSDLEDFEAYLAMADAIDLGEEPVMPPHLALNFEREAELASGLRKEIAEHHWEVAGPDAYPWLVAVGEELAVRPPTLKEVSIAEAIALALPEVLAEPGALRSAWSGGEPFSRRVTVHAHAGELEVTLRAPCEPAYAEGDDPGDLLVALAALGQAGELDADERDELEEALVRRFRASPEGAALPDIEWCPYVMSLAADQLGETIAMLDGPGLEEIVFEALPREASVEASAARSIIEELRAFYRFLRELGLEQADECLEILGGDAVGELEAALSDPRNFGMAKSLLMAGREAGHDMSTKEGIEAWMRAVSGKPLPASVRLPPLPPPPPGPPPRATSTAAARAKKDQRKAARKARKRNR